MKVDDPKLTSYALDELDPQERAEIEELLSQSPEAASEVEAMAAFAAELRVRLKAQPAPGLLAEQRAELLGLSARQAPPRTVALPRQALGWAALAASVVLGGGIALLVPALRSVQTTPSPSPAAPSFVIGSGAGFAVPKPRDGSQVRITLSRDPLPRFDEVPAAPAVPSGLYIDMLAKAPPPTFASQLNYRAYEPLSGTSRQVLRRQFLSPANQNDGLILDPLDDATVEGWIVKAEKKKQTAEEEPVVPALSLEIDPASLSAPAGIAARSHGWGVPRQGERTLQQRLAAKLLSERAPLRNFAPRHTPDQHLNSLATNSGAPTAAAGVDYFGNPLFGALEAPLSSFPTERKTASYAYVRRFLNDFLPPPPDAVQVGELINYFDYADSRSSQEGAFAPALEVGPCPWAPDHRLVRVALHASVPLLTERPASTVVLLIDVSGSMQPQNKLPLLKRSLQLVLDQMGERDQLGIVVYGGASGVVLEPTHSKAKILTALNRLEEGGPVRLTSGLRLAYEVSEKHFVKGGINRIVLTSDGDWNVGVPEVAELWALAEKKAEEGICLSVLGLGLDNLQDERPIKLADKGAGRFACVDTLNEGRKVLSDEIHSSRAVIARDLQAQIEFNPGQVRAYRLIGSDATQLSSTDSPVESVKESTEIAAGHSVTAFYEIVPATKGQSSAQPLKYQAEVEAPSAAKPNPSGAIADELLTLKLRYKDPTGERSFSREFALKDAGNTFAQASRDFRFAAAVAAYGMYVQHRTPHASANWDLVQTLAKEGRGEDPTGYRGEFMGLIEKARSVIR